MSIPLVPSGTVYAQIMNALVGNLSVPQQNQIWTTFVAQNPSLNPSTDPTKATAFLQAVQADVASSLVVPLESPQSITQGQIMFASFDLALKMLQALQNAAAVEAQNYIFLGQWQNNYTNMMTQVPIYQGGQSAAALDEGLSGANTMLNQMLPVDQSGNVISSELTNPSDVKVGNYGNINVGTVGSYLQNGVAINSSAPTSFSISGSSFPTGSINTNGTSYSLSLNQGLAEQMYLSYFYGATPSVPPGITIQDPSQGINFTSTSNEAFITNVFNAELNTPGTPLNNAFPSQTPPVGTTPDLPTPGMLTNANNTLYSFPGGATASFYFQFFANPGNPPTYGVALHSITDFTNLGGQKYDNTLIQAVFTPTSGESSDQINGQLTQCFTTLLTNPAIQTMFGVDAVTISNSGIGANKSIVPFLQAQNYSPYPTTTTDSGQQQQNSNAAELRGESNAALQQFITNIQALRQSVSNTATQVQTNISQLQSSLTQQTNFMTNIIQTAQTLIGAIFR